MGGAALGKPQGMRLHCAVKDLRSTYSHQGRGVAANASQNAVPQPLLPQNGKAEAEMLTWLAEQFLRTQERWFGEPLAS